MTAPATPLDSLTEPAFPGCFILPIPYQDPLPLCASFAEVPGTIWLDSADRAHRAARRSLLATAPRESWRFTAADSANPFTWLGETLGRGADYALLIGMLGYEAGRHVDHMPPPKAAPGTLPEAWWGLYDAVAVFDHAARRAFIAASGFPEGGEQGRRAAKARAQSLAASLRPSVPRRAPPLAWTAETPAAAFARQVEEVVEWIRAGDIYQANLSLRFIAENLCSSDIFGYYARLRAEAPAPFGAYLRLDAETAIMSASPERFLQCSSEGRVRTQPIKGTRPRSADPAIDAQALKHLRESPKERAENLMIVDLLRNDIARACAPGSVRVPSLFATESFATVHHLVSTVEGQLAPGRTAADLLAGCFPGGSITGAPKLRAMEIIHALEAAPRGAYCGALVSLTPDGAMDSSILIRTLTAANGRLTAQAGSGIVFDSKPLAEVEETWLKARALLRAADPGLETPPWG